MPRISKYTLSEKEIAEMDQYFTELLVSLNQRQQVESFFSQFLTKEEKVMLSKRLVLYMMIKKGYDVEAIRGALHVSYETVRSYTNHLATKDAQFHLHITNMLNKEDTKLLWQKIDTMLKPLELAIQIKTNMKARAKLLSGDYT